MRMTPMLQSALIMASIPNINLTKPPSEPEPEPQETVINPPVAESRQVRRARERAERKAL
jgi:hypothetical protein